MAVWPVKCWRSKNKWIPHRGMNLNSSEDFFVVGLCYLFTHNMSNVPESNFTELFFSFLWHKTSNKDPRLQHWGYKRMQMCCSATATLRVWMCIVSSPLHFKYLKVWRRVRRQEEKEEEVEEGRRKEKERRMSETVRQRRSFIQHTGGHGAVNKGSREKKKETDPISSLREHDRGIKAILKFNGPCRFPSTCNLSQPARSWSSTAAAAATVFVTIAYCWRKHDNLHVPDCMCVSFVMSLSNSALNLVMKEKAFCCWPPSVKKVRLYLWPRPAAMSHHATQSCCFFRISLLKAEVWKNNPVETSWVYYQSNRHVATWLRGINRLSWSF